MIRETQAFLKNILFELPAHIYWKDKEGHYVWCNQAHLNSLGLKKLEDIIGKTDFDLIWYEQAEDLRHLDQKIMETQQDYQAEEEVMLADKKKYIFLSKKRPLKDVDNNVVGIFGVSVDITERKTAEKNLLIAKEQAEVASRAKTDFIANMSHDLRTPLVGMMGLAEAIQEEDNPKKVKHYARDIANASRRLLALANNILEVAEQEVQPIVAQEKNFNLKELLGSLKELVLPSVLKKQLVFDIEYGPQIPFLLQGDAHLLHRILLNLLGNAIKFTEQGKIIVKVNVVEKEARRVRLKFDIQDTGMGIPKDKLAVIFEPFTRLSQSYKNVYKGNGLGLYIVKRFIEKMGGALTVASEENQGSVFSITLPLFIAEPDAKTTIVFNLVDEQKKIQFEQNHLQTIPKKAKNFSFPSREGVRVLVVEDDEIISQVIVMQLKKIAGQVDLAMSGQQALNKFKKNSYDLIYMDVGLPDKSGDKVTEEIRQLEKKLNKMAVPIIGLTAHADKNTQKTCLNAGMQRVVIKPASVAQMQAHLIEFVSAKENSLLSAVNKARQGKKIKKENIIIDKSVALNLCGSEEMVHQLLDMLYSQLQEGLPYLSHLFETAQWEILLPTVHKLHGGAGWCGAVPLKESIAALEIALRAREKKPVGIKKKFEVFITQAQLFQEEHLRLKNK